MNEESIKLENLYMVSVCEPLIAASACASVAVRGLVFTIFRRISILVRDSDSGLFGFFEVVIWFDRGITILIVTWFVALVLFWVLVV